MPAARDKVIGLELRGVRALGVPPLRRVLGVHRGVEEALPVLLELAGASRAVDRPAR
jgi:hypothetical protein